ncbi:hypothetical protein C0J52_10279 [Blattella germanica]|nr:hypothetical protein C0J52_10279 [Blattella germanica]
MNFVFLMSSTTTDNSSFKDKENNENTSKPESDWYVKNMENEYKKTPLKLEIRNEKGSDTTISDKFGSSITTADSESQRQKTLIKEKNNGRMKRRILIDVVILSVAFMIHFTAFMGTSNLQSSVNAAEGLGTMSLMTTYVFMSLSAIFLPVVLIKWLGCKWTLVVTLIAYMPYIAAQVYATFYTMIPAALLVGVGAGPLWCAQCVYTNLVAEVYAELEGVPTSTILARFFGIFFILLKYGGISSLLQRPSDEKIYTVAGIYLACMIFACLIVVFGITPLKSNIGYVLICYGITNATASLVTGYLVKLTGRFLMMMFAAFLQLAIFITLYAWTPVYGSLVFFVISGMWGVTDAIWLVQISAYSNFRTWKSVGFIIGYAYSPYLCGAMKLYIMFGMLFVGSLGYCIVEWLMRTAVKKE